jgi:hypothetical protein
MPMNLEQHRGGINVWERAVEQDRDTERWLLGMAAGMCFIAGVRRRSLAGLLLAAGGGALAWWAAAGSDARNRFRGQLCAAWPRRQEDLVGEASEESFPASDAPSWTSGDGMATPDSRAH